MTGFKSYVLLVALAALIGCRSRDPGASARSPANEAAEIQQAPKAPVQQHLKIGSFEAWADKIDHDESKRQVLLTGRVHLASGEKNQSLLDAHDDNESWIKFDLTTGEILESKGHFERSHILGTDH